MSYLQFLTKLNNFGFQPDDFFLKNCENVILFAANPAFFGDYLIRDADFEKKLCYFNYEICEPIQKRKDVFKLINSRIQLYKILKHVKQIKIVFIADYDEIEYFETAIKEVSSMLNLRFEPTDKSVGIVFLTKNKSELPLEKYHENYNITQTMSGKSIEFVRKQLGPYIEENLQFRPSGSLKFRITMCKEETNQIGQVFIAFRDKVTSFAQATFDPYVMNSTTFVTLNNTYHKLARVRDDLFYQKRYLPVNVDGCLDGNGIVYEKTGENGLENVSELEREVLKTQDYVQHFGENFFEPLVSVANSVYFASILNEALTKLQRAIASEMCRPVANELKKSAREFLESHSIAATDTQKIGRNSVVSWLATSVEWIPVINLLFSAKNGTSLHGHMISAWLNGRHQSIPKNWLQTWTTLFFSKGITDFKMLATPEIIYMIETINRVILLSSMRRPKRNEIVVELLQLFKSLQNLNETVANLRQYFPALKSTYILETYTSKLGEQLTGQRHYERASNLLPLIVHLGEFVNTTRCPDSTLIPILNVEWDLTMQRARVEMMADYVALFVNRLIELHSAEVNVIVTTLCQVIKAEHCRRFPNLGAAISTMSQNARQFDRLAFAFLQFDEFFGILNKIFEINGIDIPKQMRMNMESMLADYDRLKNFTVVHNILPIVWQPNTLHNWGANFHEASIFLRSAGSIKTSIVTDSVHWMMGRARRDWMKNTVFDLMNSTLLLAFMVGMKFFKGY